MNNTPDHIDAQLSDIGLDVETLASILYDISTGMSNGEEMDVRCVVRHDVSHWTIMTGSSDYDQWHGHCGSGSLDGTENMNDCRALAQDMYDHATDSIAETQTLSEDSDA